MSTKRPARRFAKAICEKPIPHPSSPRSTERRSSSASARWQSTATTPTRAKSCGASTPSAATRAAHGRSLLTAWFTSPSAASRNSGRSNRTARATSPTRTSPGNTRTQSRWRPSVLSVGDDLFMVDNGGVAACLDAKTGKEIWRKRVSGNFSSSPIFADGKNLLQRRDRQIHRHRRLPRIQSPRRQRTGRPGHPLRNPRLHGLPPQSPATRCIYAAAPTSTASKTDEGQESSDKRQEPEALGGTPQTNGMGVANTVNSRADSRRAGPVMAPVTLILRSVSHETFLGSRE